MAVEWRRKVDSLNAWLDVATCGLAPDAFARVRTEIRAHFASACEESMARGDTQEQAEHVALASLGNARAARKAYRKVYVTAFEERMVREDQWVASAIHRRTYLIAIPLLLMVTGGVAFGYSPSNETLSFLLAGAGLSFIFGVPKLIPINTKTRGRVYRAVRWVWLALVLGFASTSFGPENFWAGFLSMNVSIVWFIVWLEWSRASMRRKLPVDQWPRGLYW